MKRKLQKPSELRFTFFGTPQIAVTVLEELESAEFLPALVITRPDTPQGRGNTLTPPLVKTWARARGIPVLQPEKIKSILTELNAKGPWDVFIVAAYGKILPQELLAIPRRGTLNMHPSLLPKLRGPSPIVSAILSDNREAGVSVMLLDAEMDHGPILAQEKVAVADWPPRARILSDTLAHAGGALLARTLLPWVNGEVVSHEQNHDSATFCKMLTKEDGLLDLASDPYQNLLKIRALEGWPGTYAFFKRLPAPNARQAGGEQKIRVQILDAHLATDGSLSINTVRPEGKRDMSYADFRRGFLDGLPS